MKKLINDVLEVVSDALEGVARLNPNLAMIEGHATVVRADLEVFCRSGKVAIVSGGGAGHEPAHAGYVGRGMLTAAVSGDVFASPSTDAILAALRVVGTAAGILLIVKNYTGDRLNFGLAAEIIRSEGIPIEIVIVDDDAALGEATNTAGRRGIAGTVLVHKLAGDAAEGGASLADVKARAQAAVDATASMGVALSPCTVPAAGKANFELGADEVEFGLGIHGEAGIERRQVLKSKELVEILLDRIVRDRNLQPGAEVALLVNNLGGTPTMELSIVARDALDGLVARGLVVSRAYCGTFLTAIDMAGVSLSVMRLAPGMRDGLDASTDAPAWPSQVASKLVPLGAPRLIKAQLQPEQVAGGSTQAVSPAFIVAVRSGCEALIDAEPKLTEMDQRVGDGDIGRSLAHGATAILNHIEALASRPLVDALRTISAIIRQSTGGTSGHLYAIFAVSAANAIVSIQGRHPADILAQAFSAGVTAISDLGGAGPGDRTMIDALVPAMQAMSGQRDVAAQLREAAKGARAGAEATAAMEPRRGRSSYLGVRVIGHKDPGAEAIAIVLEALVKAN